MWFSLPGKGGGPLWEDILRHLMFGDIVHLLEVTEDVGDLLVDHLSPFLLVGTGLSQSPGIHTIGGIRSPAPLLMAPQVAIFICIFTQMFFHLSQSHLQREINV